MSRCDTTDLRVEECAHCRPKPAAVTGRLSAEFAGECELCLGPIHVGDWITKVDRAGSWVHRRCTEYMR